jgi:hypothetical protein
MAKAQSQRFTDAVELWAALSAAYAGSLPRSIYERGRALERDGAWSAKQRASTTRMRR